MDGDKARVRLAVEVNAIDAKTGKEAQGFGKLNRTLHMVKESGEWKIWQNLSSEEELAAALVEAPTEAERKQSLGTEKEFVNAALAQALIPKAAARFLQSDYPQALTVYELAEEIARQSNSQQSLATILRGIGSVHLRRSDYARAKEYYEKSLRLSEEIGDKRGIGATSSNLGLVHQTLGKFTVALEFLQKSLKIAEEIGEKLMMSNALTNIGLIHQEQSNYARAKDYYYRSLRLKEAIADKMGIGIILNNLGVIERYQGNYASALEYHQKSLKIAEEIGDKHGMGYRLNHIGFLYLYQGKFLQALTYHQKSLEIAEAIGNRQGAGEALLNLGSLHLSQGNYIQALDYYQKTLKITEEIGDLTGISLAQNNIGLVHLYQSNYAQALEYFQKSLQSSKDLGDVNRTGDTLKNIGMLYQSQGNYAQALEHLQACLKMSEEIGSSLGICSALDNIAETYRLQGNYTQAIEVAKRAIEIAQRLELPDVIWNVVIVAGKSYQALNQLSEAKKAFADAIAVIEETRNQIAGDEQQRQQFFAEKLAPYYDMITLLLSQNNPAEAFAFAERAKARALLDVLQTGKLNINKAMSPPEKQQEQQLNSQLVSLNTQIYKEKSNSQQDQTRLNDLNAQLQKARLEMEAFQTSLYAAHPELKIQRGQAQAISLQEAAALIPDAKTALLEFVVSEEQTYLFALTKGASQSVPDIKVFKIDIKQKELAKLCQEYRKLLADRRVSYQDLATRLYDLLLKPARSQLLGKTNLVIIPDGVLWELPFQTLQPARNHFLIEDTAISYAPSLTVLQKMSQPRQKPATAPITNLLAVGNPIAGMATSTQVKNVLMGEELLPLPEAERQVKLLQHLYTPARSKIYIGPQANEATIKTEAENSRILHLATHGVLNDASPMYSQIVLAHSEGDTNEDGLLEAWELMSLDLKADLVVLSACETARGKLGAGEGMVGLAWALFVAGSPATVVSQWKVESASTTELMVAFHRNLQARGGGPQSLKLTKAEALRRAALKLMKTQAYRHPFYWAAFVVIGDAS